MSDDLRDHVRARYAAAATAVVNGATASCCGTGAVQDVEFGDGCGAGAAAGGRGPVDGGGRGGGVAGADVVAQVVGHDVLQAV